MTTKIINNLSTGNHGKVMQELTTNADRIINRLHFAKDEPKNVAKGDILIAFAVGSGKILSIYRGLSSPQYTNDEDRWPWYVEAKNLSRNFGKNWWNNNITEQLKSQFESTFPRQLFFHNHTLKTREKHWHNGLIALEYVI